MKIPRVATAGKLIETSIDPSRHIPNGNILDPIMGSTQKLKLKLKSNLYSAIKSEDSEALDSGISQLGSWAARGGLMKEKCFEAVFKDS